MFDVIIALALASARLVGAPFDLVVIEPFDRPADTWSAGHRGVDVQAPTGMAVRAWAPGTVAYVGTIAGKPVVTVRLSRPGTLRFTYEPVVSDLALGDTVRFGEVIGSVAESGGHCGGGAGCLHIGLRTDSVYLDPLTFQRRVVLKPWDGPVRRTSATALPTHACNAGSSPCSRDPGVLGHCAGPRLLPGHVSRHCAEARAGRSPAHPRVD